MLLSIIAAMDEQGVIGVGGALPWRLPDELRRFKEITMGKPVVMGRKTHESIGRPLPGRENIILSRRRGYRSAGCVVCHSLPEALRRCAGRDEALIIGGAELYRQTMDIARRLYLTRVHAKVAGGSAGNARFPAYDGSAWRETHREEFPRDARNEHAFSCVILEKAADARAR